MIKRLLYTLLAGLFLGNLFGWSQDFSGLWKGHFSFADIVDVTSSGERIYAASENALFSFDVLTNEILTVTTIDGLSGQTITSLSYSAAFSIVIIGYENGLIELYFENTGEVLTIVDITERPNITPVNRRINNFFVQDELVYISTNYGVSVYDLERLEFGDTYFLGNGGAQIVVNQIAILNDQIYAACLNNNGLKRAAVDNPNLIDFSEWETIITGNFQTVNVLGNSVYAAATNRNLFRAAPGIPQTVLTLPSLPLDAESSDAYLSFTSENSVLIYDMNVNLVTTFSPNDEFDTEFNASALYNNEIFIGTTDLGLLNDLIDNAGSYMAIEPDGPLKNKAFKIDAETGVVWVTFGEYSPAFNPFPLTAEGISYLREESWISIPFDSLFSTLELNKITPNPSNPSQVFISSFYDGLLELNMFEPTFLFDDSNSGLESLVLPNDPDVSDIRVSGADFDNEGILWNITSRVDRPLKSYDPDNGSWRAFDFTDLIGDGLTGETGYYDMEVDVFGTKWIGAYDNGLIAYNEEKSNPLKNISTEEQNLPFPRVTAVTLDQRNQLWVGTFLGLRVLFDTAGFFENPNPTLSSIIILEDGIPQELLAGQYITDIEVDGSNNKWVGTVDSGVFYFSPTGQETIYHFTEDNSPLPSNSINDISINPNNGQVYIATNRGLVSFLAGGSAPEDGLTEAYVYPNPVRPEYEILGFNDLNDITKGVKIEGLTDEVNIKITDIEGNLVAEAQSRVNLRSSAANYNFAIDGGTAIWNGKNLANNVVASGVYVILITDLDSFETKVLKLLIIR
jgi:hypothetical protein